MAAQANPTTSSTSRRLGRSHRPRAVRPRARHAPARSAARRDALPARLRGVHPRRAPPALDGWRRASEHRFGAVTVTTLENPAPVHVLDDLVSLVDPQHAGVARGDAGVHLRARLAAERGPRLRPGAPGRPLQLPRRRLRRRVRRGRPPTYHRAAASTRRPPAGRRAHALPGVTLRPHPARAPRALRGGRARQAGRPVTLTFRVGDTVARQRGAQRRRRVEALRVRHERPRRPDERARRRGDRARPAATGACTASRQTRGEASPRSACRIASAGAIT